MLAVFGISILLFFCHSVFLSFLANERFLFFGLTGKYFLGKRKKEKKKPRQEINSTQIGDSHG
jgi:hypothetical protein